MTGSAIIFIVTIIFLLLLTYACTQLSLISPTPLPYLTVFLFLVLILTVLASLLYVIVNCIVRPVMGTSSCTFEYAFLIIIVLLVTIIVFRALTGRAIRY